MKQSEKASDATK